jgi:hypothetical protein
MPIEEFAYLESLGGAAIIDNFLMGHIYEMPDDDELE